MSECRWDVEVGWHEAGQLNRRFAAYVESPECFDMKLFAIREPEAVAMDAQQRLLLEAAWEAMQHSWSHQLAGDQAI